MKKDWTGERIETDVYRDTAVEHLHRYAVTFDFIKMKRVLDIACGEGYGSNLMASYASEVIGIDIDAETIKVAKQKYKKGNLLFKAGSADSIPLPDSCIDTVVSFETIEHHDRHHEMMGEIKRILKPGGILIISSPEKKEYSDRRNYKNPFHVKELYLNEFETLLKKYFLHSELFFQQMIKGSAIVSQKQGAIKLYEGNYSSISEVSLSPKFILGFASDVRLETKINSSFFDGKEILDKEKDNLIKAAKEAARNETIRWMQKSWTFRIGSLITKPWKILIRRK